MKVYMMLLSLALWGCTSIQPTEVTAEVTAEVPQEVTAAEAREAFTKYVIERMSEACETGKPVEITDGYWLVCRKGGKV